MDNHDTPLSELCSICHVNPPKYRCPRCATRTCSLPCTRRHKLWSQCSGVRDPAAYLKRSELANPSAFDRDFNFISGIERTLERAERDVENRGIDMSQAIAEEENEDTPQPAAGQKRKHPGQGLVKGEAGFLRGAEAGGVRVVRAPRGMSRNKSNGSRWHPKHKCLNWSVEWISPTGEKVVRNSLETTVLSEAYNRAFPLPKEDRPSLNTTKEEIEGQQDPAKESQPEEPTAEAATSEPAKEQPEQPPAAEIIEAPTEEKTEEKTEQKAPELPIVPHRDLYFYVHRPRTATKKPVLAPLPPSATLRSVLRGRTVLEFPTIYALPDPSATLLTEDSRFILEEEYLRTASAEELDDKSAESELERTGTDMDSGPDLQNVDEKLIMEVLKKDLFEPIPEGEAS
ncbi:Zinc finger HIT-type [Penicillium argentinense]|uniref:Box C/D snoRNA protein 1 n=1 Tax=Penicillium argentinense TaxID=1131581 RepID=A0A9W9FDT7_9EURO|nr:Zinc finger HIT-type [Penicillium argentinense]KAJ5098254.1 Zinc finger HIT-type [Penicillium argentinense]